MPPTAATQGAGKPQAPSSANYPVVNMHGPQNNSGDGSPCTTPHHTSSPLRYRQAGGANNGSGNGRPGCYASHHSAASFYNNNNSSSSCWVAGTGGPSCTTSFPSNELQEYISMTSPASDFYYYSPQPFYLESPAPCAAAELYGGGGGGSSPHTSNFASSMVMPPPVLGPYNFSSGNGNGEATTVNTAFGGLSAPSLMSSVSVSSSRFPQWYLPRGFYGSSLAAAAVAAGGGCTSSPTSTMYGGAPACGYYATAATSVNTVMPHHVAVEDAVSCWENGVTAAGGGPTRYASGLPLPPQLTPQASPRAVGPLALPPSVLSSAPYPSPSSSSTARSLRSRPYRPQPFMPYDGRAYGLPVYCGISCADAAVAIARSALAADASGDNHDMSSSQRTAATPQQQTQWQQQTAAEAAVVTKDNCHRKAARGAVESSTTSPAATSVGEEKLTKDERIEEEVYSPEEKALLVDAHKRLARLRAKTHEVQQQQQQRQTQSLLAVKCAADATPSSPSATPTGAEVKSTVTAAGTAAQQQKSSKEHASPATEEVDIPISPIPHLPAEDSDTARLEESLMDEMEFSQRHSAEAAEEDTRAVLEQVLSVRGVKWRHDPYSRRVLAQPTSCSSVEEADEEEEEGGSGERWCHTPLSPNSESVSPQPRLPRGQQLQGDTIGRKRPTPDESELRGDDSTVVTQPPCSPNTSLHSRSSHDDGSNGSGARRSKTQPSARRMPIKKVCVRHFVRGGSGERPVSADGAVGVLASVITQPVPYRAASAKVSRKVQEDDEEAAATAKQAATKRTMSANPSLRASTRQGSAAVLSLSSAHTQQFVEKERDEKSEGAGNSAAVTTATARVPPPRSRQQHCDTNEYAKPYLSSTGSRKRKNDAAKLPPPNHQTKSNSGSKSSTSSSADTSTISSSSNYKVKAHSIVIPDPALKHIGPFTSKRADESVTTSSSWAWRARVAQKTPAEALGRSVAAAHAVSATKHTATWNSEILASSAEAVDTSFLVRLSHQLTSNGCFRDIFAARQLKLGAESNNSTGVVSRSVARRFGSRQGVPSGNNDTDGSKQLKHQQFAMLRADEVTHVYVLRHRCRTSCAVGTRRYECGTEVVVDGDMGVDTGVVMLVMTKAEYYSLTPHERQLADLAVVLEDALAASIHRPISAEETLLKTTTQRPLEDATLAFVRYLTTQPHLFLSCRIECMNFVDVEFQADGQKLYVFYQTTSAVRFLELATYLNHIFHCRIWMKMARDY